MGALPCCHVPCSVLKIKQHETKEASQMKEEMLIVDISHEPSVVYLAEIVQRTRTARLLRRNGEDVALLLPVPANRRRNQQTNTKTSHEAFRPAAESWQDADTEQLLAEM
jgi:hypothetical protein